MTTNQQGWVAGMIGGAVLMLAPFAGIVGSAVGMTRAFSAMSTAGISDPKELSDSIATTLLSTVMGFGLGVMGLVVFIVCLLMFQRAGRRDTAGESAVN